MKSWYNCYDYDHPYLMIERFFEVPQAVHDFKAKEDELYDQDDEASAVEIDKETNKWSLVAITPEMDNLVIDPNDVLGQPVCCLY